MTVVNSNFLMWRGGLLRDRYVPSDCLSRVEENLKHLAIYGRFFSGQRDEPGM